MQILISENLYLAKFVKSFKELNATHTQNVKKKNKKSYCKK